MAEGHTISNIPGTVNPSPDYYNPNYDPCYPEYPWPVITTKVVVNGCPSELWPLLQELGEIKNLLQQLLDRQGDPHD